MVRGETSADVRTLGPHVRRVALIRGVMWGSGYSVGARVVLTSGHVVGEIGADCTVYPEIGEEYGGSVVWRGDQLGVDAALIFISGNPWEHEAPVRWARLEGLGYADVLTLGYAWVSKNDRIHHIGEEPWETSPTTGWDTHGYILNSPSTPPSEREIYYDSSIVLPPEEESARKKRKSPWGGLSGGPVLTLAGALLGVVRGDQDNFPHSRLSAVRATRLLEDASFARFVGYLPGDLVVEPTRAAAAALRRPSPPETPVPPEQLCANRVPIGWRLDGTPCPLDDAYAADLGAWIVLGRGPSTHVVAATSSLDLAAALSRLEDGPVAGGGADVHRRTWASADASIALPEREAELSRMREARSPGTGGAGCGLVVIWPAGESGYRAGQCRNRIRALAPNSAVVFLVHADLLVDALSTACEIARAASSGQGAEATEVFALTRFEQPAIEPADTAARVDSGGSIALRLRSGVLAAQQRRGLRVAVADTLEPLTAVPGALAAEVAAEVVAELDTARVWGGQLEESATLRLIRDYQPHLFHALINCHAARRSPPDHWISLHAAAGVDRHVDAWLLSAQCVGEPRDVPATLRDSGLVDTVVLGMLRTGTDAAESKPWHDYVVGRRTPVGRLVSHLRAADQGNLMAIVTEERAEVGSATARAGLLVPVPPGVGADAWWAILGRMPVTTATIGWLTGCGSIVRRAVGFTDDYDEPDPDRAELAAQLRAVMCPPLPVRKTAQ